MRSEKDIRKSFGLKATSGTVIAALFAGVILACASVYVFAAVSDPAGTGVRLEAAKVNSTAPGPAVELLGSSEALDKRTFQDTRVGGLSALTYDPVRDLYYALVDRQPRSPARFYALRMPADDAALGDPDVFEVTILRDEDPFAAGNFDGEGIALAPWGDLYAASENEPSIRTFLREGRLLEELAVPDKFLVVPEGQGRANGTFEGLAFSPSGDVLFAAFQKPLLSDGSGPEQRQPVRILRYERSGTEGFRPTAEYFYSAESGMGISEIAAVSETGLLVLEGTNELFRVDLSGAGDVSGADTLAGTDLKPLEKSPLVDVDNCVADAAAGGIYEGMALGPELPSGRQTLMLVSDDNFDEAQTTRVVGLGVRVQHTTDGEAAECGGGAGDTRADGRR